MPRVTIKKKDYMVKDLSKWIKVKAFELGINQTEIGEALGISQQCVSYRLRTGTLSYAELLTIFKMLKPSDEEILKFMRLEK